MRYTTWVSDVLRALQVATRSGYGGVGLAAIGQELGVEGLTWDDFVRRDGFAGALMTAMEDLAATDLVEFVNVGHGNSLTATGRDVASAGLQSVWPELSEIRLTGAEGAFLARLIEASRVTGERWADFQFVDADPIYRDLGLHTDDRNQTTMQQITFYGDLERKLLVKPESRALGSANRYRPTYIAAVIVSEADARDYGLEAGLIDWSTSTPGFEAIADRLAELKVRLANARSDDDLSDIGRRCRDVAADAMDVVFQASMVPAGATTPSRQDAKARLGLYLDARIGGSSFLELRGFLRAALALASARTHSARTGHAAAVAAAQGLLSFVRAIEAIERSSGDTGTGADAAADREGKGAPTT